MGGVGRGGEGVGWRAKVIGSGIQPVCKQREGESWLIHTSKIESNTNGNRRKDT